MSQVNQVDMSFEQFVVKTAEQIGVSLANAAIEKVKRCDALEGDSDFADIASTRADVLVEKVREEVTDFASQVIKGDDDEADTEDVKDYADALLEGLAEVAVEWLTVALFCKAMGRNDLIPHEDLLAAAVTGVFVAEVNVEDDDEDGGEESAPEVEDDEDDEDDDQYQ